MVDVAEQYVANRQMRSYSPESSLAVSVGFQSLRMLIGGPHVWGLWLLSVLLSVWWCSSEEKNSWTPCGFLYEAEPEVSHGDYLCIILVSSGNWPRGVMGIVVQAVGCAYTAGLDWIGCQSGRNVRGSFFLSGGR